MKGTIWDISPWRADKDLGKAYNDAFKLIGEDDWLCLRDKDTLFLTHDAPKIIESYVDMLPNAGIFTCYTNRISLSSKHQLLQDKIDDRADMRLHIQIAEMKKQKFTYTELHSFISGFLMVISKRTWNDHKFKEGAGCLGIDNEYSQRILDAGLKIVRMNSVYLWHSYRLLNGIHSKKHLL